MIIHQALAQSADTPQQIIEHQHGTQLAADFVEQLKGAGLAQRAVVEPRIFNRHGDARGQHLQQIDVLIGEVIRRIGLQVHHANNAILQNERHRQLRLHSGNRFNIRGVAANIVHQDGALFERSAAHNAFANLNAEIFNHVFRMARARANAKLLRFLVQQENGEDLIINDATHQLGNALHQFIEIERRGDLLADLDEQTEQLGGAERPGRGFCRGFRHNNLHALQEGATFASVAACNPLGPRGSPFSVRQPLAGG